MAKCERCGNDYGTLRSIATARALQDHGGCVKGSSGAFGSPTEFVNDFSELVVSVASRCLPAPPAPSQCGAARSSVHGC
jgi:hypothetical protein